MTNPTHTEILTEIYSEAEHRLSQNDRKATTNELTSDEIKILETLSISVNISVLAVVVTSLTHKVFNPSQDVRFHGTVRNSGHLKHCPV